MAWRDFPSFTSSNIALIRYDNEQATLEVGFHNGGTYHYYDVPSQVADELERAESKGSFLASSIKGHYRYSKV
ncbi:KTSC domain-containing protein [uncultured Parvibaculum sp.]|uniref:KTSC domain-containing protein n=1 Tax=uncultured Parvibaculum sp. TaxID=291828 RepID=UPI0030DD376D